MKYSDIMTASRVKLRDGNKTVMTDQDMLSILVDGVLSLRRALALRCPDMFWTTSDIPLTVIGSYGPYNLPTDVEIICGIQDDATPPKFINKTSREKAEPTTTNGQPCAVWYEGFGPIKAYFDRTPDKSRTYKLYYIAVLARATDMTLDVPLPDYCFEVLDTWTVTMCGNVDEYATMPEEKKMLFFSDFMHRIIGSRESELQFSAEGTGI